MGKRFEVCQAKEETLNHLIEEGVTTPRNPSE